MIVAFSLFKYFPFGGLQRDFLRIARAVETKGAKVRVYVQSWDGERPSSFEIITVPVTAKTNHGQGLQFSSWVQKHLNGSPADVVVGFNKMPGLDFYYAADVCYEDKVCTEKRGLKGFLYRMTRRYKHFSSFERAVFAQGQKTKLLMISEAQISLFKRYYLTEDERFILLPPGISPDRKYSCQPSGIREQFRVNNGIAPDQNLLLQLGSDFKRKGVDRTLQAIAALPDPLKEKVVLLVVGQDNPSKFERMAETLGISKNVRFFKGRSDVPAMLSASDVFLHPAYFENTGTVILEALVAGVPLIVTAVCGYAGYVNHANCGCVLPEPYQQRCYNDTLVSFLSDEKLRLKYAENARTFADTADLYSMIDRVAEIIIASAKPR